MQATAKNKEKGKYRRLLGKYFKLIVFIPNLLVILCLLFASKAWTVPPTENILYSFLGIAYPILLILNLFFAILWLVLKSWVFLAIQLLAFILCIKPIGIYFPKNIISASVPEKTIKLLSYNVHQFRMLKGDEVRTNPIFDYILDTDADIICLQEFYVTVKKNGKDFISYDEVNEKFKDYPYRSLFKYAKHHSNIHYGLMCYSKYPIKESEKLSLGSTFNGCGYYVLDVDGKKIALFNAHLESNKVKGDDKRLYKSLLEDPTRNKLRRVIDNVTGKLELAFEKREYQVGVIRKQMDALTPKVDAMIVCGDFNDTPISYAYGTLKGKDMSDAYTENCFGPGITFQEDMFPFRIDHILYSGRLNSYGTTIGSAKHSDHYYLYTYLKLKAE